MALGALVIGIRGHAVISDGLFFGLSLFGLGAVTAGLYVAAGNALVIFGLFVLVGLGLGAYGLWWYVWVDPAVRGKGGSLQSWPDRK